MFDIFNQKRLKETRQALETSENAWNNLLTLMEYTGNPIGSVKAKASALIDQTISDANQKMTKAQGRKNAALDKFEKELKRIKDACDTETVPADKEILDAQNAINSANSYFKLLSGL